MYICVEICIYYLSLLRPKIRVTLYKFKSHITVNTAYLSKILPSSQILAVFSDIQHSNDLCGQYANVFSIKACHTEAYT
jgi:hypothetical protein